jgi:hypothetical protein
VHVIIDVLWNITACSTIWTRRFGERRSVQSSRQVYNWYRLRRQCSSNFNNVSIYIFIYIMYEYIYVLWGVCMYDICMCVNVCVYVHIIYICVWMCECFITLCIHMWMYKWMEGRKQWRTDSRVLNVWMAYEVHSDMVFKGFNLTDRCSVDSNIMAFTSSPKFKI